MEIMPLKTFIYHFLIDRTEERNYCFILGSGASSQSGIATGKELVDKWLEEIKDKYEEATVNEWVKKIGINEENKYGFYSEIYDFRFKYDKKIGYSQLESIMENKEPSCGYSILARILSKTNDKMVITVNFDNLIEEALYTYTKSKPLVISHEALAGFAKPFSSRPIIAKIHRDQFLRDEEINRDTQNIETNWIKTLENILKYYTPLVIGYGGNDGSLMNFLEKIENIEGGIFWCYKEDEGLPTQRILDLIKKHKGYLIPIEGFDELMIHLGGRSNYKDIGLEIVNIANERAKKYNLEIEEILNKVKNGDFKKKYENSSPDNEDLKKKADDSVTSNTPMSNFSQDILISEKEDIPQLSSENSEINNSEFSEIDKDSLSAKPNDDTKNHLPAENIPIHNTLFHKDIEKEKAILEEELQEFENITKKVHHYNSTEEVLQEIPESKEYNSDSTQNNMLKTITKIIKEPDKIIKSLNKMIKDTDILHHTKNTPPEEIKITETENIIQEEELKTETKTAELDKKIWLQLLFEIEREKDLNKKDKLYQEAIKKHGEKTILSNYANFLYEEKKDYDKALECYKKLIENEPNNSFILNNYATFLVDITKEYEKADEYYRKAIDADPDNLNIIAAYAKYLTNIRKNYDKAEQFYSEGLAKNTSDSIFLCNYADFLKSIRKNYDKALEYYNKAINIMPQTSLVLGSYAVFLTDIKKDYSSALSYFEKALDMSPNDSFLLVNYSKLLILSNDLETAKEFIEKAFRSNKDDNSIRLELWFLRYIAYKEWFSKSSEQIDFLLSKGTKSSGTDFAELLNYAKQKKHSDFESCTDYLKRMSK